MKFRISKTKVISFSRKANALIYDNTFCQPPITRTDSIKDLGIFTGTKLHFYNHINYIFSRCIYLLGLARTISFTFSCLEVMQFIYYVN
jgi:hypothetical protein